MTKLNVLLLLALIASALLLVKTAYDARLLFTNIHRAEVEAVRLDGEHKRLEADRQLQATNLRVERTARERLKMRTASPAVTMYESPADSAGPAPSAAVGATP
ncbi:MAG: cell division protein FtsL [Burkholderiales bacterium RIFCSPHIGHO2_12_FULL_69_20]|nr:MAG: cell division protein FtsL [Burkholderiales bacterium RIFCSPHIGHO2_12_FULL_69_20]